MPLSFARLAGRTGRGVTVAVVDSGIDASHPQVGAIAGGVVMTTTGLVDPINRDVGDRLGHGTAVAATIREKAPASTLMSVKVFDQTLRTTGPALVAAIRWAIAARSIVINLSLGTTNQAHAEALASAVADAADAGVLVVAAAPDSESDWLPGGLPGVIGVEADPAAPRDAFYVRELSPGRVRIGASPRPRPAPGVSAARQFQGPSFAVANVSGLLALLLEDQPSRDVVALVTRLL